MILRIIYELDLNNLHGFIRKKFIYQDKRICIVRVRFKMMKNVVFYRYLLEII
jgi:hypothetical protein